MWYLEHLRSGKGDRKGCPAAIRWAILEKQPARRMVPDVDTNVDAARLEARATTRVHWPAAPYWFAVCANLSTNGCATAGVAAPLSTISLLVMSLP
jgi:hypothetical protein